MKNRLVLFLIAVFNSVTLFAQMATGFESATEASDMAKQILKAAGRKANFEVKEAAVPNAVAVLTNGRRYILYNPDFIDRLTRITGTRWAAVSVLAHEIGHHLNTHTINGKTIPMSTELEADEFSGFVLRKMGASLEDAQAAMKTLASTRATSTHPARHDRLASIENGWDRADETGGNVAIVANPPGTRVVVNEQTRPEPAVAVLDRRSIVADIHFTADPESKYHITARHNVVRVQGDQLSLIGRLAKINNRDYPYMIFDEDENRVYVSSNGTLINARGTTVGKLTLHKS